MSEREYDVPAVRKAISLIELLCESPVPLGVTEISQRLDLNKNMVFRLVRTLSEEGWIVADGEEAPKYRMTLLPFQHASKPVNRLNVRAAAMEPLSQLWEATQQSCYLCILDRNRALCVEHWDGTGVLRVHASVGGRYHLNATAPGKILLAHAPVDLLSRLGKDDLPKLTSKTIVGKPALKRHLAEVVRQGYAVDDQENAEGVLCYAVPVRDYEDKVVGTLGLSTLTIDYSVERMIRELGPLVNRAGRATSSVLGASQKS